MSGREGCAKCCEKSVLNFRKLMQWDTLDISVVDSSSIVSLPVLFFLRLACLCASVGFFSANLVKNAADSQEEGFRFFSKLTYWNAITLMLYFSSVTWLTLRAAKDPKRPPTVLSSSPVACFAHFFFELGSNSSFLVSVMYWVALYPTDKHKPTGYFFFLTFTVHALVVLLMLVEIFLTNQRQAQFHLVWVLLYYCVYLIANYVVTVLDERVYGILTYEDATTGIWVGICFGLALLSWLGVYFLLRLRMCLFPPKEVVAEKTKPAPVDDLEG